MKILAAVTLFSFVGALTAAAVSDEEKEHEKQVQQCLDQSGLAREKLANLQKGDIDDAPETGKYLECAFKTTGMLNDAGEYQTDIMKVFLLKKHNEEGSTKIIEDCTKEKLATAIETAVHLAKCYHKHVPQERD